MSRSIRVESVAFPDGPRMNHVAWFYKIKKEADPEKKAVPDGDELIRFDARHVNNIIESEHNG